jgi:hypothetical protein
MAEKWTEGDNRDLHYYYKEMNRMESVLLHLRRQAQALESKKFRCRMALLDKQEREE